MFKNQHGFHLIFIPLAIVVLAAIGFTLTRVMNNSKQPTNGPSKSTPTDSSLPDISYFLTHKSDQFLVDMAVVNGGHPYKGTRAITPHTGAHVLFVDDENTWPKGGTAPQDYPPIYAVADGVVDHVDETFSVPPNDRYGIDLTIAKGVDFGYSIEPFVKEPSAGFYKTFLRVKTGDQVKKGQIIAYMYLPPGLNGGTHIHFDLSKNNQFMAPAIFTPAIVQAFHDRWGGFGYDGASPTSSGTPIPVCMGYMLSAAENPFGTGAVDCLE